MAITTLVQSNINIPYMIIKYVKGISLPFIHFKKMDKPNEIWDHQIQQCHWL